MIGTVANDQHAILRDIAALHCGGAFDVDCTYSTGGFYRHGVPEPRLKFDLEPQCADVVKADCRALPLGDGSVRSIVFDPPCNHAPGKASVMGQRFGGLRSQAAHHELYRAALAEFARVLPPGGLVIFKCQDTVESSKQVWNHVLIYGWALEAGFIGRDLFILVKRSSMRGWNWARQQHAHRKHSYFWVFEKAPRHR